MTRKRVTMRKHFGDDIYSWCVFVDGVPIINGLSRDEARYYRDKEIKRIENKKKGKNPE
jgi:hypothetical protein